MSGSKSATFLLPLLVVSVCAAGYLGLENFRKQRTIEELRVQLTKLSSDQPTAEAVIQRKRLQITRKPSFSIQDLTCSLCNGEGELTVEQTRRQDPPYPCPLCKAQGQVSVEVPAAAHICMKCGGMGKIAFAPEDGQIGKYIAKICTRCNGRGWRKSKT